MTKHKIATVDEVREGRGLGVEVDGIEIAVFLVDGEYYAIQNKCVHKGGPLYKGPVSREDCSVFCPWHMFEWDLETGQSAVNPGSRMRTFDVEVAEGDVFVVI